MEHLTQIMTNFIFLTLVGGGITYVLVESDIFSPFRDLIGKIPVIKLGPLEFSFAKLLDCTFCTGIWVFILLFGFESEKIRSVPIATVVIGKSFAAAYIILMLYRIVEIKSVFAGFLGSLPIYGESEEDKEEGLRLVNDKDPDADDPKKDS